ncbi:histidyl-tRNA synthetase [Candidatus Mancarchaeum acidiphilum]|uniref:Histidine--tRNA ligase n=1 Tax=Candidatus Mancarchaeum acidiphilum TaxID=1920749 RepID=A0A218NLL8_9ARCH|nr:histidine--tRNA ligase [Candidatus Mancarchaeum acidiphilum]ASI13374.1 histidyl-tRNA synthetase [Candidatus Mancarchaeum acidiphilum]
MVDLPFPKGFRDMLPNEALFRSKMLRRIEDIFQLYGFMGIYTPKLESMKLLRAKESIGEENKLIFELKNEGLGLRYDQTVSLARYFIMHSNLPLPFKRYSIGEVWRMDEPQRLRYREFTQADIDIIGGDSVKADAEIIAAASKVYEAFGVDYKISINDRKMLDEFFAKLKISKENQLKIMRAIDKIDKLGITGVKELIKESELKEEQVNEIIKLISFEGTNTEKLNYIKSLIGEEPASEIENTILLLESYGIKAIPSIDFSTVRGIDYYTSIVFEFKTSGENAALGGGGRYDNLISNYGGKQIGAVGFAVGVDRLLDVLKFQESKEITPAEVFISNIKKENYQYALKIANDLRSHGIKVDLNDSDRNLSNQLSYSNAIGFKYTIFIGPSEQESGKAKVRDMKSGTETLVEIQKISEFFKASTTK